MINYHCMTVTWHVDDLKVIHKDEADIGMFADFLQENDKPNQGIIPTYHCGKVHDYIGITLDYLEKQNIKVSMIKYTNKSFKGFSEERGTLVAEPITSHLFTIQEE